MIISNDNSYPILIDDLDSPIVSSHFWTLDLKEMDFKLSKIKMLEAIETPSIVINVMDYVVRLPASWYILISSEETHKLDAALVSDLTKGGFEALVLDHKKMKPVYAPVKCVDYLKSGPIYTIALHRHQMMCHALGSEYWLCVTSIDVYNKYLKNKTVWDIL